MISDRIAALARRAAEEPVPAETKVEDPKGKELFDKPWDEMLELRQDEVAGKDREHINWDHLRRRTRHYDLQDAAGGICPEGEQPPSALTVEEGEEAKAKLTSLIKEILAISDELRG